ncbi:MAG: hypothetical protein IT383_03155 [Deltaproteobacteria bacterium]|nr:hypothetical protein [Deltaproteobacteria bacterium]
MALLCPNPECRFLRRLGVAASYRAGVTTCADCGAALVERADVGSATTVAVPGPVLWSARHGRAVSVPLLVSAACVVGMLGLGVVPLPYLDGELVQEWLGPSAAFRFFLAGQLSVGALGIAPWITAALLVEIAAAVVPRWRPLREAAGRAALVAATDRLGVVVAGAQALLLVPYFESMSSYGTPLLVDHGLVVRLVLIMSMVAGAVLVRLAARVIDAHGVGGGMTLLAAAPLLIEVVRWLYVTVTMAQAGELERGALVGALLVIGGAVATTFLVRPFDESERPPLPVAGVLPMVWATAAVQAGVSALPLVNQVSPSSALQHGITGACSVVLTIGLGRALHLRAPGFGRAVPLSMAFVLAIIALSWIGDVIQLPVAILCPVVLACVARDLTAELSFRRRHGQIAVVAGAPSLARARELVGRLTSAGLSAHVRAAHHRALWHFFGPHLALDVLVPAGDAEQARALVLGDRTA